MIRSLFSGVSGMKNHQIRMDVVGNNISNVNTNGYKAARANFQDTLYQTIKNGGMSTNPAQAGLGINVASISSFMNSGPLQSTGRTLDLAINGNGFFRVKGPNDDYYTREGIFYLTQQGNMVNSNGYQLIGDTWKKAQASIQISDINKPLDDGDGTNETITITVRGLLADGNEGIATAIKLNEGQKLNDIIEAINAEQSKSGVTAHKKTDENGITYLYFTTVFDGHKEDYEDDGKQALEISITSDETNATNDHAFFTFTDIQNYISAIEQDTPIKFTSIPISSINIQPDGTITGFDNQGCPLSLEDDFIVARINLYLFENQDGLERVNQNLFKDNISSGTAEGGNPGEAGYGTIESGFLEMSNVQLTDEFTNMIVTQRGYQANSRIITVSDTMLEELLNLKR